MNGSKLHALIYKGRGKAAKHIGLTYTVFRPLASLQPLGNRLVSLPAAFNSGDSTYAAPNLPGDAIWYGDFDGRQTVPGDYLVGEQSTFFVAGQQPLLPIICIECNRRLTVLREPSSTDVGAVGYGGIRRETQEPLLGGESPDSQWPASILIGGRGEKAVGGLPGDVKSAGWRILLPPSVPVALRAGDIAIDDLGRRFAFDAAEQTDLGWRINAVEVHA